MGLATFFLMAFVASLALAHVLLTVMRRSISNGGSRGGKGSNGNGLFSRQQKNYSLHAPHAYIRGFQGKHPSWGRSNTPQNSANGSGFGQGTNGSDLGLISFGKINGAQHSPNGDGINGRGIDSRVEFMEKLLLQNGNSILAYNLKEKLRNLDNFRANTEVELAAIKEILTGVQKQIGKGKPAVQGRGNPASQIDDSKLHDIIYRSK